MASGTQVGSIYYDLDLDDKKFKAGADSVKGELNQLEGAFSRAEQGSKMFLGAILAIGAAGVAAAGFGIKAAAEIETMTQGFVTLLGSTEKADEAIKMIQRDAAKTPFEFAGLVKANQLLTSVTGDAGRSERLLLNIGKGLTAMGRSGADLDRVIFNLQQIANTGKITEMDIRQFGNAGINILDLLAKSYGVTKEEAGEMVKDSKDAFGDLEKAFQLAGEGSGKFAKAFELQGGTFNQLMSNMKDNVSITMSSIVKELGLFDLAKTALGKFTDALGKAAKPENIEKIKEFFGDVKENGPIAAGILIGALTPALYAMASGVWAVLAPLIPFIVIGALLGLIIKVIVDQMGGWNVVMEKLNLVWDEASRIFNEHFLPPLKEIWKIISEELIPQLKLLWEQLSPILIPVLQFLVFVVLVALLIAIRVVIEIIKQWIIWVTTIVTVINWGIGVIIAIFKFLKDDVVKNVIEMIETVKDWFDKLPGFVKAALSGLLTIITGPFIGAWRIIEPILDKIKAGLDKINPFHRESPSLVDNVIRGVGIIKEQYASLGDISFPTITGNLGLAGAPASTTTQNINIHIDKVGDQQDVNALGRELGFRAGLMPR